MTHEDNTEYIEIHRDEVENEYRQVLDLAERNRQYWEERNRERLARIAKMPPEPKNVGIWNKLQTWKTELARQESLRTGMTPY